MKGVPGDTHASPRHLSRRCFLLSSAAAGIGLIGGGGLTFGHGPGASERHRLPALPYPNDALEPFIDVRTMRIHHGKHHAGYVRKLNGALESHPDLQQLTIESLLRSVDRVPESVRQAVIDSGGGHANHSLFWQVLTPKAKATQEPGGRLAAAVQSTFGSTAKLREKITEAGLKRFGSGWAWLVRDREGKLEVLSTANQDSPLMQGKTPLFGIDVWEHAYYLNYQNRRGDYLEAIWNITNWEEVERRYTTAGL